MDYDWRVLAFIAVIGIIFYVPFLRSFFKLLILFAWGLFIPVGAVFVIITIRIPQGDYIFALLTIAVVVLIQIPWFLIGAPEIKNTIKNGEWSIR